MDGAIALRKPDMSSSLEALSVPLLAPLLALFPKDDIACHTKHWDARENRPLRDDGDARARKGAGERRRPFAFSLTVALRHELIPNAIPGLTHSESRPRQRQRSRPIFGRLSKSIGVDSTNWITSYIPKSTDPAPDANRIALNIPPDCGVVIAEVVVVRRRLRVELVTRDQ